MVDQTRRKLLGDIAKFGGFTALVGAGTVCSKYAFDKYIENIEPTEEEKFEDLWEKVLVYLKERDEFYMNNKELILNPKTPYSKIFELENEEEKIMNKILLSYCEKYYPELVEKRRPFNWRFWEEKPENEDYYIDEEALEKLAYNHGKVFIKTPTPDNITKMDILILGDILEEREVREEDEVDPKNYDKVIIFRKDQESLDTKLGLEELKLLQNRDIYNNILFIKN